MSVAERLESIAFEEHISVRQFELSINKKSGYLNMMKKNKGAPSVSVIVDVKKKYPKYNAEWIIGISDNKYADKQESLDVLNEDMADYGKADFLGMSKRLDVVIKQNTEILDKLNRGILKDMLESEKSKLEDKARSNNH